MERPDPEYTLILRLLRQPPALLSHSMNTAEDATRISQDLMAFLHQPAVDEHAFNTMALRLFRYQAENNRPFQRYCQMRGKTPRTVSDWREIPAVPISAFKDLDLTCIPTSSCERIFMTSGTTRGAIKGRHYHPSLSVYDASMQLNFAQHIMQGKAKISMGILFPTADNMPHSSLAHYLHLAVENFGAFDSHYFIGPEGLDATALALSLQQAQETGTPYALLGASYSMVHALDAFAAQGLRFHLPQGSWILDTGGFKGQSREIDVDTFYNQLSQVLGVPRTQCFNMYGMTELSTQFYDAGNAIAPSIKRGPHWIRTRVVDPLTGQEMPHGERGVLVHTDLANYNSVTTLMTEDVGLAMDHGFALLGRVQGAQAKGCSMAIDAFLQAAKA